MAKAKGKAPAKKSPRATAKKSTRKSTTKKATSSSSSTRDRVAKRDPETGVLNVCGARLEGHPYRCDLKPHPGFEHEAQIGDVRITFNTKTRKITPIS